MLVNDVEKMVGVESRVISLYLFCIWQHFQVHFPLTERSQNIRLASSEDDIMKIFEIKIQSGKNTTEGVVLFDSGSGASSICIVNLQYSKFKLKQLFHAKAHLRYGIDSIQFERFVRNEVLTIIEQGKGTNFDYHFRLAKKYIAKVYNIHDALAVARLENIIWCPFYFDGSGYGGVISTRKEWIELVSAFGDKSMLLEARKSLDSINDFPIFCLHNFDRRTVSLREWATSKYMNY